MTHDHREQIIGMLRGAARAYTAEADALQSRVDADKEIIGTTGYMNATFTKIVTDQAYHFYGDPRMPVTGTANTGAVGFRQTDISAFCRPDSLAPADWAKALGDLAYGMSEEQFRDAAMQVFHLYRMAVEVQPLATGQN